MEPEEIARVAHEVNRAYCAAIGDGSHVPWAIAPDWQRDGAIMGVVAAQAKPDIGPGDMHRAWCERRAAEGWAYGPVKDADKREHPCMAPFEELPAEQRVKDHLFLAVVRALA